MVINPTTEEIVQALRCRLYAEDCSEQCICYNNRDFRCPSNSIVFEAAADRLEELEAEQPRWISVEEPPKENCTAWIFDRSPSRGRGVHLSFFIRETGWMPPIIDEEHAYWMPIIEPEPPKEG